MTYIILIFGYHKYGTPLGSGVCRICYLTSKESIFTLNWVILTYFEQ